MGIITPGGIQLTVRVRSKGLAVAGLIYTPAE